MSKVIALIAALALFGALPAVAAAQTEPGEGGDTISSGNTQSGEIEQSAQGGNAGNQGAIVQQNAGEDANAHVNQSQNFGDVGGNGHRGHGGHGGHVRGHGGHGGSVSVHGVGGHGGGVGGVSLARTGFDAWILALIGGATIAGGIGLLAAQRRGRLSA